MNAYQRMQAILAANDYRAMLRANDIRRAENAASRERAQRNPELCAALLAEATRRGQTAINWDSYFVNMGWYK